MSILSFVSTSVLATALVTLWGSDVGPRLTTPDERVAETVAVIVPTDSPDIALPVAETPGIPAISNAALADEAVSEVEAGIAAAMRDPESRGKVLAALVATIFLGAEGAPGLR